MNSRPERTRPPELSQAVPLRVFLDTANMACRPNGILSSRILTYLQRNGHQLVPDAGDAEYIVCNTCGFDGKFRGISMSLFSDYEKLAKPGASIVSVGCLNTMYGELGASYPHLIRIADFGELDTIFFRRVRFRDIKEAYLRQTDVVKFYKNTKLIGWSERLLLTMMSGMRKLLAEPVRRGVPEAVAYQHVMDEFSFETKSLVEIGSGCASNCSYCVIKKAKGPVRSRAIEDILGDVEAAREVGRSLCLVADDCGSYGLDIGESLPKLVRAISGRYPELPLDILYLNPHWLEGERDAYSALLADTNIRSINIPIQSGSPRILSLMNRHYDVGEIAETVRAWKRISPETLFYTHIMVGFPSETEADFRKTLEVLEAFDIWWHFRYTDHEGTPASKLSGQVPEWRRRWRSVRLSLRRLAQHLRFASAALFPSSRCVGRMS